ncbi:YFE9-like protein [Mya arenaria]|uniref:YFE9-like protein n=1 Tax=Mya arenaria TaxID=6604 RepID=A0ABY7DIB7_MYAAR|nr:YFE9-like protein [Mya arenaria]
MRFNIFGSVTMSEKKEQRIERKKRKAAAFLDLIKSTNDSPEKDESDETVESPSKKIKLDSGGQMAKANNQKEKSLSDEMYEEYKRKLKERDKVQMQRPKVFLTLDELARDNPHHIDDNGVKITPPLFMTDVQHLLMYAVLNVHSSFRPRWCRLLRVGKVSKVVAVVLDSVSSEEFNLYKESLPTLHQAFDLQADMIAPVQYGSSVREDIMNVPIKLAQLSNVANLEVKKNLAKNSKKPVKSLYRTEVAKEQKWQLGRYKQLRNLMSNPLEVLTGSQVRKEGRDCDVKACVDGPVKSNTENSVKVLNLNGPGEVNVPAAPVANLPVLTGTSPETKNDSHVEHEDTEGKEEENSTEGNDVITTFSQDKFDRRWFIQRIQTKASKMDLARVSILDENLGVVYDSYVKPHAPVTDYVTQWSGITKEILDPVTTRLEDVQRVIQQCLPGDAILCGQSISSDLNSMKMFHPYIIDTSVIYNLTGTRQKTGLKKLADMFLGKNIQSGSKGHSSVEDAIATMELVLLKLRNEMDFGDISIKGMMTKDFPENNNSESSKQTTTEGTRLTCSVLPEHVSEELRRKRLFFQQEGKNFVENFLHRMAKHGHRGNVIDEATSVELYPPNIPLHTCGSDKESERLTLARLNEDVFCLTHLYGFRNFRRECDDCEKSNEEELKKCLWKLDRRFWKILMGLPACSLFVVVFKDGCTINSCCSSHSTMAGRPVLQMSVNTSNWELKLNTECRIRQLPPSRTKLAFPLK